MVSYDFTFVVYIVSFRVQLLVCFILHGFLLDFFTYTLYYFIIVVVVIIGNGVIIKFVPFSIPDR